MTLEQWKRNFKKANQRVDKAFANFVKYLDSHYWLDENSGEYHTLGNGCCLRMNWFAGRKSGWSVMCWATECGINYRRTSTGKYLPVSYNTVKRLEDAIESAIDNRECLLDIVERSMKQGLAYDVYKDDSVWTNDYTTII